MPSLAEALGAGGPIILLLAVLSVLSLALIAYKVMQLWHVRSGEALRTKALGQLQSGETEAAIATMQTGKSPADRVGLFALEALRDGIAGHPLEAELIRRGNEEVARLSTSIRLLELIAMISPLLGLLGTVTGMIQSFQELELAEGAANASVLAGGIWQALLTTAAGLVVAIPAAVAASLLAQRIETAGLLIETAVGRILMIEGRRRART